jgi:hypothetical protein
MRILRPALLSLLFAVAAMGVPDAFSQTAKSSRTVKEKSGGHSNVKASFQEQCEIQEWCFFGEIVVNEIAREEDFGQIGQRRVAEFAAHAWTKSSDSRSRH